jgi:hypothetical protein
MWRALFLAMGVYCCILGAECLAIDKAVLNVPSSSAAQDGYSGDGATGGRVIVPPAWAPWSLISGGAVVVLYSFTIPKRAKD